MKIITQALDKLGYTRLKGDCYSASWSSNAVEHVLFVKLYGNPKPKIFLMTDFGFRNSEAQRFGIECSYLYLGTRYKPFDPEDVAFCPMRFPFGNLASWGPRWSLVTTQFSPSDLEQKIISDIERILFPLIKSVTTTNQLLSLLLKDEVPVNWYYTNGAMRAAQIVDLARQVGMPRRAILAALSPHKKSIACHISTDIDVTAYLDRISAGLHG